jgi:hypothetical protein
MAASATPDLRELLQHERTKSARAKRAYADGGVIMPPH